MKVRQVRLLLAVATCALALGVAPLAYAQKITGDITGTVTDPSGAALSGVAVNAVCPTNGLTRGAVSGATGGYTLSELPVCVYKLSVAVQGFKTTSRDVHVAVSNVTKADFR